MYVMQADAGGGGRKLLSVEDIATIRKELSAFNTDMRELVEIANKATDTFLTQPLTKSYEQASGANRERIQDFKKILETLGSYHKSLNGTIIDTQNQLAASEKALG